MVWAGPAAGRCNANDQSRPRIPAGLVVGRDLFLRHLLVANVSDGPLRAYWGGARLRPVAASGNMRRLVPCSILRRACAACISLRSRSLVSRALPLGFFGIRPIRCDGSDVECDWLFAGVSSAADSIRPLGRSLRD